MVNFWQGIRSVGTLDLRSLALMRIGVAVVLLMDLIIRFTHLEAHYTDNGVLPLPVLFERLWNPYHFSIYTISTSAPLLSVVFLANLAAIGGLLVGYRTRLFTSICWIFLLSLHNRNPLNHQAGDDLLRMLLFWAIFLPWGYCYSVDSRRRNHEPVAPPVYVSFAGFAYLCQVAYVYFFSALLKTSPEWTSDFTALYYALSLDQVVKPFGKLLYPYGNLLKFLTASVYYTELLAPLLLLIPFRSAYFRLAFILLVGLLQIGISFTLYVGLFPLISVVALLGLIPGLVWETICRQYPALVRYFKRMAASGTQTAQPAFFRKSAFPTEKPAVTFIVAGLWAYGLLWNIQTTGKLSLPGQTHWVAHLLRVDQFWGMFAPEVFKDDGWFVLAGKTSGGQIIDLTQQGKTVSYARPASVAGTYTSDRWRKYLENILFVDNHHYRLNYCFYWLNTWNRIHPAAPVRHLDIFYMKEVSLPDYRQSKPTREWLCNCRTD